METTIGGTLPGAAPASVVYLKLQEYARRTVAEQARFRAQLEALVTLALRPVRADSRLVLDTPDGLAVVMLDDPRTALDFAEAAQSAATDLPLAIGINHGPVKPAAADNPGGGLVGDGISTSAAIAGVGTPGRFLASRSFREALAARSPDRAAELSAVGEYTDGNVRTHALFATSPEARNARIRRLAIIGFASVAVVLGIGVTARVLLQQIEASRPAFIVLEITPRGDVIVDGAPQGRSPPLTRVEVPPGKHTIEVRNGRSPPLKLNVELHPRQEMVITHAFATAGPRKAKKEEEEGFLSGLRRKMGW
jgi:hypothetical protein